MPDLPPLAPRSKFQKSQLVPYQPGAEPMEMPPIDMSTPLSIVDLLGLKNGIDAGQQVNATPIDMARTSAAVSSRAKHKAPLPPVASLEPQKTEDISIPSSTSSMAPSPENRLSTQLKDFAAQQREELANAASEKELSTGEKVAMALLSILPGLVGGIGGGLVGGAQGAATGLAGGTQGAAAGIQALAGAKKERRKEAFDKATDLQNRMDKVNDALTAEQDKTNQRGFVAGEADKDRKEHDRLLHEKAKIDKEMEAIGHKHALGRDIFQAKSAMDIAKLHEQGDLQKAMLAASSKETKAPTEFEGSSAYHADAMAGALPALLKGAAERGTLAGALKSTGMGRWFADPALQQQAIAAKTFINAINRRESGAAITDQEIESAYDRYLPVASDSPETIAYKQKEQLAALRRMSLAAGNAGSRINMQPVKEALEGGNGSAPKAPQNIWSKGRPVGQ